MATPLVTQSNENYSAQRPHVIIVGGAIAGTSLAVALAEQGLARKIDVLEQRSSLEEMDLQAPSGVGFTLLDNACHILLHSNLFKQNGFTLSQFDSPDFAGTGTHIAIKQFQTGDNLHRMLKSSPSSAVHRKTFIKTMYNEARRHADIIHYHWNMQVSAAGVDTQNGKITTTTGDVFQGDLIIGCDGVRSHVRQAILRASDLPVPRSRPLGVSLARFSVPRKDLPPVLNAHLQFSPDDDPNVRAACLVFHADEHRVVIYPMRKSDGLVNVVVYCMSTFTESISKPDQPEADDVWRQGGTAMLEKLIQQGKPCTPLADLLRIPAQAGLWQLRTLVPLPTWSHGKACVIGDAAHPMAPFQGSGAAIALEDVEALTLLLKATVLQQHTKQERAPQAVFDQLYNSRILRASIVQLISDRTPFPQSVVQTSKSAIEAKEHEQQRDHDCDAKVEAHPSYTALRKRIEQAMQDLGLSLDSPFVTKFAFDYSGFEHFVASADSHKLFLGPRPTL